MSKIRFIKGFFKFLFYPKISLLSFVSNDCKIDKTSVIYRFTKIKNSEIGRYSYISANSDISSTDIGNFCSIADHVTIGLPSHTLSYLSTSPIFTMASNALKTNWIKGHNDYYDEDLRTHIGNDVWIGSHVLIKAGVRIHEGSVIGAGAVVTKDVPPYTIVGGVPAKIIRKRFDSDTIEKIRSINWWSWPDDKLKKQIKYFQMPNIDANQIDSLNE